MNLMEDIDAAMQSFASRVSKTRPSFKRPVPATITMKAITIYDDEVIELQKNKEKFLAKLLKDGRFD